MLTSPRQAMQHRYQAGGLHALLEQLCESRSSGVLYISAQVGAAQNPRDRVLIWRDGEIVYGGVTVPDAQSLVKTLAKKFKPEWADSALGFTAKKVTDRNSIQEPLGILVKLHVLEWQQVKDYVREHTIWTLEQVLAHAGQATLESQIASFDLCYEGSSYGFDWQQLLQAVADRQLQWNAFAPTIPSMEAIPTRTSSLDRIPDGPVGQHIEKWIDRKHSLVDIAVELDRDPIQLAQIYRNWVEQGWIKCIDPHAVETSDLPVILSVDDSPIIQTMIKRALSSQYEVLLANKALDAMNLLNQQGDRISLLILDLTMPDIDGLELCRTIRSIPKFKHLPIIMLTARDGFFDKMKGHMVGSDRYLTKPFEAENY